MEIGGLGFVNTIASGGAKDAAASPVKSGFAGVFASLMQGAPVGKEVNGVTPEMNLLSNGEIQELVDFLNTTDILDLDEGLRLLDSVMSGETNVLDLIKEHLGLSGEQLQGILKSLKELISKNTEVNELEAKPADQEIPDELESLVAILNLFSSMKVEDLPTVVNKDFADVAKVVKLFDLLSKHQDIRQNNLELTKLVKKISEKLEVLLQNQKQPDKMEYLQKTFTPLVAELNKNIEKKSRVTDLTGINLPKTNVAPVISRLSEQTNLAVEEKLTLIELDNVQKLDTKIDGLAAISIQHQQTSKPEQLTLMLGNSHRPVSTDQLIQQFESILSKSQFMKAGGTQKLFIRLNPEHLGSLRIEIIQKDSNIIAKILTSTGAAKDTLDAQLNHLKNAFSSQNIQVDRIEVTQQMTQSERSFNREQQQQEQQRQDQQRQKEQKQTNEFTQSFEEALLSTEA